MGAGMNYPALCLAALGAGFIAIFRRGWLETLLVACGGGCLVTALWWLTVTP